jgi:hypothetical protein
MTQWTAREDVVALAYHVDYWDYLGWKDQLGSPDNTERQYAYRQALSARSVYTPQAVLTGASHVVGSDRNAIEKTLGQAQPLPVGVNIDNHADMLTITTSASATGETLDARVLLVRYKPEAVEKIERGENRGKTITYLNSVVGIQTIGMWHGRAEKFELPLDAATANGAEGCAILVQTLTPDGKPARIIGAAQLRL